ncbi:FecCD family ABC transporter permease [Flexivirga meconopsidis]|uniref:FecCD family ABC transporter permease n=1 Tax=Flexivirga meconopsidis TaxID=2977121 RepID=UPI002240D9F0|nr:iron ABC transporter permease [Flexivirga meconopsidis]
MADTRTLTRQEAPAAGFLPWRVPALAALVALLLVAVLLSLAFGSKALSFGQIWTAVGGGGPEHVRDVLDSRVPRTVLGLLVGGCLAVAGVVMQGLSRNPLGDPGLLGVNAGAATGIVVSTAFLHLPGSPTWAALPGAFLAMLIVTTMGSGRRGVVPVRLVLSGAVVTAVLTAVIQAITLTHPNAFDDYRYWAVGSLAGGGADVMEILPWAIIGLVVAGLLATSLNALALGEEIAISLGSNPAVTRWAGIAAATVLSAAATSAAGPIAFVGLAVPHLARAIVGPDHRWQLPAALLIGPSLLLIADVVGRLLLRPQELQVGVVTAFVGAPVLLWLVRRTAGESS